MNLFKWLFFDPDECDWDDFRCSRENIWATMIKEYNANWNRMKVVFPKRWLPPLYDPIEGPTVVLDFKPVLQDWFRKYEVMKWGLPFNIRPGYGLCVFTGMMGGWLISWNYRKVVKARKTYNVPNPVWASDSREFNCIWRAYQNMVEAYPQFLFFLLLGGVEFPYIVSFAGWFWLLGRFISCKAWHAGKPRYRYFGSFYMIASFIMMWATIKVGRLRLRYWHDKLPDYLIFKPNNVPFSEMHWIEKYYPEFLALKRSD